MKSLFFDSQVGYDSESGRPIYDRPSTATDLRAMFKSFISTGVYPNPSTNFQVEPSGEEMTVIVQAGLAWIEGAFALEEDSRTLTVQASSTSYDRIDRVVLRLNLAMAARSIDLYVLEGTPAPSPTAPALTRNNTIYEIALADLFIAKNTSIISAQRITDTRGVDELCGWTHGVIDQVDTTTIFNQYKAWFDQIVAEWEEWWNNQQDRDGYLTVAGINPSLITVDKTIIGAINETNKRNYTFRGVLSTVDFNSISEMSGLWITVEIATAQVTNAPNLSMLMVNNYNHMYIEQFNNGNNFRIMQRVTFPSGEEVVRCCLNGNWSAWIYGGGGTIYQEHHTYINASTGNDATGDHTLDKPFKTLQGAIDAIPRNWGGRVVFNLAAGTYTADVTLSGTNVAYNQIAIVGESRTATIINGRITITYFLRATISSVRMNGGSGTGIYFNTVNSAGVSSVTIADYQDATIFVGSIGSVSDTIYARIKNACVYAQGASHVRAITVSGSDNNRYGYVANGSTIRRAASNTMTATTLTVTQDGGEVTSN